MSWLRHCAAATMLAATFAAASRAHAFVYTEQGDAGGRGAPQATIGSGPLDSIKGTIGELLPASQLHDLVDAFTFGFLAAPDPFSPGLLLPARIELFATVELLPAVQFALVLLDEAGGTELARAVGDGSVRIAYDFLPAVQKTTFHVEIEVLSPVDPPFTIILSSPDSLASVVPSTDVPVPGTLGLFAAALAGFGWMRRRKRH